MKSVIDLAEQVKDYAAAGKTIAPVENGATAVGSYAIGEQFIREGVLYKAKTSITAGDTLTLNTNYELADDLDTQIGNVKQALSDEVEARAELGAHNLIPFGIWNASTTYRGIVWTVNSDGTVNGNGTVESSYILSSHNPNDDKKLTLPAGSYILSGCPSGGGGGKYVIIVYKNGVNIAQDDGEGSQFTLNAEASVSIRCFIYRDNGATNITFKPMIRLATDTDSTYQPYAKTNTELTKDDSGLTANAFENGCVNLLENKGSDTVYEGIAYTVNSDGSIRAYGTLNANKSSIFYFNTSGDFSNMVGKRVKLSGCPKVTGFFTRLTAYRVESVDGSSGSVFDEGDGVTFDFLNDGTGTKAQFYIEINNLTSSPVSINTTFKPMITVADMPNSDYAHYVPYCKSNKELTDDVANLTQLPAITYSGTSYSEIMSAIKANFPNWSSGGNQYCIISLDNNAFGFAKGILTRSGDRVSGILLPARDTHTKEYVIFCRLSSDTSADTFNERPLNLTKLYPST